MFRRDLINLLQRPRSVHDLARELALRPREIEDDLEHLLRTLKHSREHRVVLTPARCRHCGFTFHHERLAKPGKCPRCRHTWIDPPLVQITRVG